VKFPELDSPGFGRKWIAYGAIALVLNLALLGGAVFVVVKVLQWTGVLK